MTSGLKMLSSCKGCSAFVDCLLFGNKHLSYTCKCVLPFPPPYANLWTGRKIFNRPHETFSSFWGQKLFCGRESSSEKRVAPLSGTSVAAFLARKLGKLGSLITWRFATAKFPTGNIESWNFITTCIEGANIHIYWWRKGCKSCHSSTHSGKVHLSIVWFPVSYHSCSARPRNAWLLYHKISDHHFSGGYTVFHVWSPPIWNYELLYPVSLILCTCFAMSHVLFVRLCRGFVGRQLVKPIVTRNMANARKNKVLVTRSVPQAAIEIIKSSHR